MTVKKGVFRSVSDSSMRRGCDIHNFMSRVVIKQEIKYFFMEIIFFTVQLYQYLTVMFSSVFVLLQIISENKLSVPNFDFI